MKTAAETTGTEMQAGVEDDDLFATGVNNGEAEELNVDDDGDSQPHELVTRGGEHLDLMTEENLPPKVEQISYYTTPTKYPGAKAVLFDKIARLIAPYVPARFTLVDTCVGGGSCLCGFENYFGPEARILNDVDADVCALWHCIEDKALSNELAAMIMATPSSREGHKRAKELMNSKSASVVEKAFAFIYLGKTSFRGMRHAGPWGGKAETEEAKKKISHFYKPADIARHIHELHNALWQRLTITKRDLVEVIKDYDKPNHVLFVDPPYIGTGEFYTHTMDVPEDHVRVAEALRAVKNALVVITYCDCPQIRELYEGCERYLIEDKTGIRNDGTIRSATAQLLILMNHRKQAAGDVVRVPARAPDIAAQEAEFKRSELLKQEAIIEKGGKEFFKAGDALRKVRDEELYCVDYSTFEQYVLDRWGLERSDAYRKMETAEAAHDVSHMEGVVAPMNQYQMEFLRSLDTEARKDAWREAVRRKGGKQPSGHQVRAVVVEKKTGEVQLPPSLAVKTAKQLKRLGYLPETALAATGVVEDMLRGGEAGMTVANVAKDMLGKGSMGAEVAKLAKSIFKRDFFGMSVASIADGMLHAKDYRVEFPGAVMGAFAWSSSEMEEVLPMLDNVAGDVEEKEDLLDYVRYKSEVLLALCARASAAHTGTLQ